MKASGASSRPFRRNKIEPYSPSREFYPLVLLPASLAQLDELQNHLFFVLSNL